MSHLVFGHKDLVIGNNVGFAVEDDKVGTIVFGVESGWEDIINEDQTANGKNRNAHDFKVTAP